MDPLQATPILVVAAGYTVRARTLARRGRPVTMARRAWFYAGVVLLLVAVASPIHDLAEQRLLYVHMIQHLLIGDLAALALVLGLDGPILRPLLAFPPVRRLRFLGHPLIALPLWVANLYLWHIPGMYEAAIAHPLVHAIEHELFLATGILMWAAVVEPLPGPAWFGTGWKALYVLVVRAAGAVLANVFIWSGTAFYPSYAAGERAWGISPLTDQATGGLIMFVEGGVVTLGVFAWLFLRWTGDSELRQSLLDEGHEPALAERAARYRRSALASGRRRPR